MNPIKFCFIACVNNDEYEAEMLEYITALDVPAGFETEYLGVREAKSMCAGYNEGMNASDAKYKIYLHQDVFVVNRHFLYDLLDVFSDENVGMMGLVGSPKLPNDCVMWHGPRVGKVYYSTYYRAGINLLGEIDSGDNGSAMQTVECVDGFLIATQRDIPWREDLFTHFDFYDISQSMEMRRAGCRVVVPKQNKPWCMHDDAFMNLVNYEDGRRVYINEYLGDEASCLLALSAGGEAKASSDALAIRHLCENKKAEVEELFKKQDEPSYQKISQLVLDSEWFDSVKENDDFAALYVATAVYREEAAKGRTDHIFSRCDSMNDVKKLLFELRMRLYRVAFMWDAQSAETVADHCLELWDEYPSLDFIWRGILCMVPKPRQVSRHLQEIFESRGYMNESLQMLLFMDIRWPGNLKIELQAADALSKLSPEAAGGYISKIPQNFWEQTAVIQAEMLAESETEWMEQD